MKTTSLTTFILAVCIITACHSKKTTTSTAASAPKAAASATTSTASAAPVMMARSSEGINAPGEMELVAIQKQYADATLDQLKEGHALYTQGACTKCHDPKNIYKRGESQWKNIIEDMAQKAKITDAQKDAVYKYVLSIKATQPQ
jgi:cytochrome c551/c552